MESSRKQRGGNRQASRKKHLPVPSQKDTATKTEEEAADAFVYATKTEEEAADVFVSATKTEEEAADPFGYSWVRRNDKHDPFLEAMKKMFFGNKEIPVHKHSICPKKKIRSPNIQSARRRKSGSRCFCPMCTEI